MKATFEFLLTRRCNLTCSYCFERDSPLSKIASENLNTNEIFGFMGNVITLYKVSNIEVIFSGGEPLIRFDLIKKILNFLYDNYPNLKITPIILTNGILLNKSKINYLNKRNARVKFSIDGGKEINDLNRKFKNSHKSVYEVLINKIGKINHLGATVVVTPKTVDSLFKSINVLFKMGVRRFYLNFDVIFSDWSQTDLDVLWYQIQKIGGFYLRNKDKVFIDFLEKKPEIKKNPCYTYYSKTLKFVIMPNGDILPCGVGTLPFNEEFYKNLKYGNIKEMRKIGLDDFKKRKAKILNYTKKFAGYICYKKDCCNNLFKILALLRRGHNLINSKLVFNYFNQLNIILTRNCNLNCAFCRVLKNDKSLNIESLITFLDNYKKINQINILKFLGGEPLLEWNNLKKILAKYNKKTNFEINTNAKMLTPAKVEFLKKIDNCSLVLSFDHEKWTTNEFLYQFDFCGVHKLKEVYINITISPTSIGKLEEELLPLLKLKVKGFRLLPVFYTEWSQGQIRELIKFLKKNYLLWNKKKKVQNRCYAYQNNFLMNNHLTIDVDGGVFYCDAVLLDFFVNIKYRLKIGDVKDKDIIKKMRKLIQEPGRVVEVFNDLKTKQPLIVKTSYLKTGLLLSKIFEGFNTQIRRN